MRIIIDCRMLTASGIGRYIKEHLIRRPAISQQLVCICCSQADASWVGEHLPNVETIVDTNPIYSWGEQFSRLKYSKSDDIVWTPHYNFAVLARGTQIVTVHDVVHIALPDIFGRGLKRVYAKFMLWAVSVRARRIIFVSEFTRGQFGKLVREVPDCRTAVTLCGIQQATVPINPAKEDYFIYVGNVKPHKNLGRLLRAFASIADKISTNLVIVGKRDGFITGDALAEELKDPRIEGRVKFTGHVDDDELARLYSRAKALVFPSLYEGFGLPPLEAMTAGCPALVSNAASIPEVCGPEYNEDTGEGSVLYFDPMKESEIAARILKFVAMSPDSINQMTQNGKEHSLNWRWADTTKQTWDLILEHAKV